MIFLSTMNSFLVALFALITCSFRTRAALQTEILALRHRIAVLQANAPRRLHLKRSERVLWVLLSRFWSEWRRCLRIVQPDRVIRWHRRAFALHWRWKSRRRMSQANRLWGPPPFTGNC
jgi:putative transposase